MSWSKGVPRDDYLSGISAEALNLHAIFAQNIKEARKARGWSQIEAAERCLLSRGAYRAVEKGELGTAIGVYWLVLDTFGLLDGVAELAAPHKDEIGRRNREVRAKR
ncbi:helix-turn-helix domain-containing protein [Saccharophagus degradans]|uniref:Helix-turn-helix transcriptional regulator n=1 Tax=Saccharophagus degradans TaxID=86304 RepID=A0AAW7X428_9GAMM|nr:helix-turn-helix transcriptional regulator [Saccharophagus degradans]MDO6421159.1 helix-turn-helix transcriptional regulator [Saccharophagus degradans]MDO6605930.1 helix-turn-helix transcriptional regulator [Saccharophagus degradans]